MGLVPARALSLLVLLAAAAAAAAGAPVEDPAQYVNPFVGTDARSADVGTGGGAGNTSPAATAPFGMIQWGPDTIPGAVNIAGGYSYAETLIRGFSLTHMSGAGCPVFWDVPILPTTIAITQPPAVAASYDVDPTYVPSFGHADEQAEPGYYRVGLDPGTPRAIEVALAARTRSAVGRFTYPASTTASVLVNAGGSAMANGDVSLTIDPAGQEVSGSVSAGQFCYHRNHYTLYFTLRFSRPFAAYGTWRDQMLAPGSTSTSDHAAHPAQLRRISGFPEPSHTSTGAQAGAWVSFDTTADQAVEARVGISFASLAGARANLAAETPTFDLDAARAGTRAAWNAALDRIEVSGGPAAATRTFYTMLYHALLAPNVFSDVDGSYAGMDGAVHTADGRTAYANFSGWDIYRGEIQLLALLDPARTSEMIRSLLADAQESGWLPRWPVANGQTDVMVGDPADPIIASAHAFGARAFDATAALAAMVQGATDSRKSANAEYVERQALADYIRLGWVPHDGTEGSNGGATVFDTTSVWGSAATTLEYAVADFAIARLAAATGDRAAYKTFMRRSGNWRNLYNRATGYLEPRYASGAFEASLDPLGGEGFAEGNAAQYTWMVPFDPDGLFATLGGRKAAAGRLDRHLAALNEGPHSAYAFLANEPELGVPWLYDWLGQPWKTQRVVRAALLTLFDDTPAGYSGNDDLGAMSAWYVFGALGFYPPVPGEGVLALGSPLFPEAVLHLAGGDVAIRAPAAAAGAPYVRRLTLDGRRWERPWVPFDALACGARLAFDLAHTPGRWGTKRPLAPPSYPSGSRFPRRTPRRGCA